MESLQQKMCLVAACIVFFSVFLALLYLVSVEILLKEYGVHEYFLIKMEIDLNLCLIVCCV